MKNPKILKCLQISILLLLINHYGYAQVYGNEWINPSLEYFKIPVAQTGIYRITYTQLQAANFPVNTVNPQRIRLYNRGNEQAIFVSGESDAVFDTGDYIEFYGKKNDGTQDALLYTNAANQVNKYYNLYSDTTAYFLTYSLDATPGKRIATYSGVNTTLETYHLQEGLNVYSNAFYVGQKYPLGTNNEIHLSDFDAGEGWASASLTTATGPLDFTISVNNINASVPNAILEVVVVGTGFLSNAANIFIGNSTSSLNNIASVSIQNNGARLITQSFNTALITGTGQAVVRVSATTGFISVAYIRLRYPQTFNMASANSQYYNLVAGAATATVDILNPPSSPIVYDVTDPNNLINIAATPSAGKITCNIANTGIERLLYAYNSTTFLNPNAIQKISFTNINPTLFDYLIITHKKMRQSVSGVGDVVQAYADYRASVTGGSFSTLIMDIDVLYNQFNYGERSPLAIRNFANYMYKNGTPRYMLLIGKSISLPDQFHTNNIRQNSIDQASDLVPTFGFPPSDNQFTIGLNPGTPIIPVIPTGRLSTSSASELNDYLNKVKEYESPQNWDIWKKNFIHLSGGRFTSEQISLKAFIDSFKSIAENGLYAAKVKSLSKQTTNAVELINISAETNNGLGMITFFGHSTRAITDIEIGYVSDDIQGYRNKGKYPMVLANGCQLASIFYNSSTLSEDWIFTKDRGSVNFLAHSYIAFTNPLRVYTTNFYDIAFNNTSSIGKSIGNITQRISGNYTEPDELNLSIIQQMLLQGDPAINITPGNKPDYALSNGQLSLNSFDGNVITTVSDSFNIKIATYNLGIIDVNPIQVSIKRTFPNGTVKTYTSTKGYSPVKNTDTLYFTLRREADTDGFGLNRFEVALDYLNDVAELNENNNIGIIEYFMPGVGVIPVIPNKFGIVNSQSVILTALASDLINATNRSIIFELDTTILFNSLAKKSFTQNGAGAIATWETTLLSSGIPHDSTVYFWRVNYEDQLSNPNALWGQSSFVYISTSPAGWYQGVFSQFLEDPTVNVTKNTSTSKFDFAVQSNRISVSNCGSTAGCNYISDINMLFNGLPLIFNGKCGDNVMNAMVFNKNTGLPYLLLTSGSCGREPFLANAYNNINITAGNITNYINSVPTGDYVLLFTTGSVDFSAWTITMKNKLQEIGANPAIVNTLQTGYPYIIFGRKGNTPGTAVEVISGNLSNPRGDRINLNTSINLQSSSGTISSVLIGPAKQWRSSFNVIKKFPNDNYQLDLLGVNFSGQESTLFSNITTNSLNLNSISASQYPYLKFKLTLSDIVTFDPAQLKKWAVIYDGVPEAYINTQVVGKDKYVIKDKQEGETFNLEFAFENLTSLPFTDSILVEYTFTNYTSNKVSIKQAKIKALQSRETVRFSLDINTIGNVGDNELRVFVNPRIQPEQFYENNILAVKYKVLRDNTNPILEVAFDGRQIIDGEIVSPKPSISIRLSDKNTFLNLTDTSNIDIAIKRPCTGCNYEKIAFLTNNIVFSTANGVTEVNFQPKDALPDGIYALRVQGSNSSGINSGINPYIIHFEVVNESSITNFFPYPNPFSTSTRFVFTLTGTEVPDQIKIQIMTVSGKIVREITQDELGPIHVGSNLSDFTWNGTDEYGDQLANGVYIYRVIVRKNGESIQQRETAADKAFKQGFGKLYILR